MAIAHCLDCGIAAKPLQSAPRAKGVKVCGRCRELREQAAGAGDPSERVCVNPDCERQIFKPLDRPSICARPACQRWRHNRRRRLLPPQATQGVGLLAKAVPLECEYYYCDNPVPPSKKSNARFCSAKCRMAHNNALRTFKYRKLIGQV
jgi:hypothetical protein